MAESEYFMFNFWNDVNLETESHFFTTYLSKEDKKSVLDFAKELDEAIADKNSEEIIKFARSIINVEKRNQKIERHERVIKSIMTLLETEMKIGDYTQVKELAEMVRKNYPIFCLKDSEGRLCSPEGAVVMAFNRLIDTGNFAIIHAKHAKYFKRIK